VSLILVTELIIIWLFAENFILLIDKFSSFVFIVVGKFLIYVSKFKLCGYALAIKFIRNKLSAGNPFLLFPAHTLSKVKN